MESWYWMSLSKAKEIARRHPDPHPFYVAEHVDEEDKIVALLHDSLEDGHSNLQELGIHFSAKIVLDVITLTRLPNEAYKEYIGRIRTKGGRARRVKIADLKVNLARCEPGDTRIVRYSIALDMLEAE